MKRQPDKQGFFIVSAYRADLTRDRNIARHKLLVAMLETYAIAFKEVDGAYDGEYEQSVLIADRDDTHRNMVDFIVNHFEQDAYLYGTSESNRYSRDAWLVNSDTASRIGEWKAVPRHVAENRNAYTRSEGYYYIAG